MAAWEWQHGNGSMGMAAWEWQHGNDCPEPCGTSTYSMAVHMPTALATERPIVDNAPPFADWDFEAKEFRAAELSEAVPGDGKP